MINTKLEIGIISANSNSCDTSNGKKDLYTDLLSLLQLTNIISSESAIIAFANCDAIGLMRGLIMAYLC